MPKHTGGQKPPVCFLSFKAPQHQESMWNEQTQPQTPPPPRRRKLAQKCKNAASIIRMRFGTSCASGMIGVVGHCKGVIDEHSANEEAAEKHFHVLATSPEALSTIRQCCQDMEVLFSDFHVGNMGVGVVGGCHGCRFCHLGCVMRGRRVLCLSSRIRKMPCNWQLQGIGTNVGVVGGWHGCRFGCWDVLWMSRAVLSMFGCQSTEIKKNPVNVGLPSVHLYVVVH